MPGNDPFGPPLTPEIQAFLDHLETTAQAGLEGPPPGTLYRRPPSMRKPKQASPRESAPPTLIPEHTHKCAGCGRVATTHAAHVGVGCKDITRTYPFCSHCQAASWSLLRWISTPESMRLLTTSFSSSLMCDSMMARAEKFLATPLCKFCQIGKSIMPQPSGGTACSNCGARSSPWSHPCYWCQRRVAWTGAGSAQSVLSVFQHAPCDTCIQATLCGCNGCAEIFGNSPANRWDLHRQARLFERDGTPMTLSWA